MQDFIPRKIDINGFISAVTVKQYDNNSRFLHVTLSDSDLSDGDSDAFILQDCSAKIFIKPEGSDDPEDVNFVTGEVADEENGVVTFLLPGSVTQVTGRYECEIWIYGGDETQPIISTKPFALIVEKSIRNDSAIEASQSFSALDAALLQTQGFESRISALEETQGSSEELEAALEQIQDISDRVEAIEENHSGLDTVQTQIEGIDSRLAAVEESNSEEVTGPLATLSGRVNSIETTLEGVTFSNGTVALNDLNICSRYIANVDSTYSEKSRLISNVNDIGTFYATQNMTENGQTTLRWTDLPAKNMNFIVTNAQYSLNWMLQTAVSTASPGIVYNRLIPSAAGLARNYEAKNWACVSYFHYAKTVLVIGDSISYGWRTNYVGYVGLLGLPYQNESVAGATLSTNRTDVTNIPDQLDGVTNYTPNIIIANGGINDYIRSAPLGTVPPQPVTSSTVGALDLSTVTGGLQKLFYLMITKYPTAHRYFIITHKTFNNSTYYVTTQNSAGYTQQDLHDAIVACCRVYNVEIIDVYEKGFVNSFFEEYRASVHYVSGGDSSTNWEAAKSNTTDYVDGDGIHPLIRGYQECYVPLIREAIKSAM